MVVSEGGCVVDGKNLETILEWSRVWHLDVLGRAQSEAEIKRIREWAANDKKPKTIYESAVRCSVVIIAVSDEGDLHWCPFENGHWDDKVCIWAVEMGVEELPVSEEEFEESRLSGLTAMEAAEALVREHADELRPLHRCPRCGGDIEVRFGEVTGGELRADQEGDQYVEMWDAPAERETLSVACTICNDLRWDKAIVNSKGQFVAATLKPIG